MRFCTAHEIQKRCGCLDYVTNAQEVIFNGTSLPKVPWCNLTNKSRVWSHIMAIVEFRRQSVVMLWCFNLVTPDYKCSNDVRSRRLSLQGTNVTMLAGTKCPCRPACRFVATKYLRPNLEIVWSSKKYSRYIYFRLDSYEVKISSSSFPARGYMVCTFISLHIQTSTFMNVFWTYVFYSLICRFLNPTGNLTGKVCWNVVHAPIWC